MKAFMRAVFGDDQDTIDTLTEKADEARKSGDEHNAQGGVTLLLIHGNTPEDVALLWRVRKLLDEFEADNDPLLLPSDRGECSDMTKDFVLYYDPTDGIRAAAVGSLLGVAQLLFFSVHTRWDNYRDGELYGLHDAISLKSVDAIEKYMQEDLQDVYYLDIIRSAVRAARAILDL